MPCRGCERSAASHGRLVDAEAATNPLPERDAASREACLSAIVKEAAGTAERLVIERDESTLGFDGQVLYAAVRRYGRVETLHYELMAPHRDPLP